MRAIFQLLDTYGQEVRGRESPDLPDHVDQLLDQFVQGRLDEQQRLEVFSLLKDEPAWTEALAFKIKNRNLPRED